MVTSSFFFVGGWLFAGVWPVVWDCGASGRALEVPSAAETSVGPGGSWAAAAMHRARLRTENSKRPWPILCRREGSSRDCEKRRDMKGLQTDKRADLAHTI